MFNLSYIVRHKITGEKGIVVGYGHWLLDDNYLTTIKVKITSLTTAEGSLVAENLLINWLFEPKEEDDRLGCQNNSNLVTISGSI